MSLPRYANSCQIDSLVVVAAGTLTMVSLRRPGEFPSLNNIGEKVSIIPPLAFPFISVSTRLDIKHSLIGEFLTSQRGR
ncbi:hypothetical protein BDV30DRAFT_212328 [Aspergillus minisclerotigenes]|uniref:Uncharacterized protein n=1 Tax=Aspergillus minisclerotigenes TaxID=656917 RepID=A0A5N6J010_9EURO|nr:hypothetical protein BDV30DRAFT_212328 [Aspergillus minisclerotigenes]